MEKLWSVIDGEITGSQGGGALAILHYLAGFPQFMENSTPKWCHLATQVSGTSGLKPQTKRQPHPKGWGRKAAGLNQR